jgi:SSS family solute:Na+ symporter
MTFATSPPTQAELAAGFTTLDWLVLIGLLLGTTWLGHRKAGRQESARDFFLGGKQLPWWVVSASIVATEISAVTFISLPSVVYRTGGDITYLQIGLFGSMIARALVGYVLLPAYYEREIYSPYEYVAQRLGRRGRGVTTALFTLGGILGQSARVYLTALVLEVLLQDELVALRAATGLDPLVGAVLAIGVVAIAWTWMGGIAAVVWTDAVLFLLFLAGIAVSLVVMHQGLAQGLPDALARGAEAGKFRLIDTSTDPAKPYTLWVAIFVASWGQVAPYGCDQLMVQRLFCCADVRAARKAILASIMAMGVTFSVALVGIGLWAWFQEHTLSQASAELLRREPDKVFPLFIATALPSGLKGLVLAGAFAAAISSLDSILAALTQTTMGLFPDPPDARTALRRSRALVLLFGVVLCAAAVGVQHAASAYDSILDLALAMAGYTGGALLAAVALSFLKLDLDGSGLVLSAPLSVLAVLGTAWHAEWTWWVITGGGGLTWLAFLYQGRRLPGMPSVGRLLQGAALLAAVAGCLWVTAHGTLAGGASLPWPWYPPIGALVAFGLGWLLDARRLSTQIEPDSTL